jgi:hypothetical protein
MPKQEARNVTLRIVHDGVPPNVWGGGAKLFGVQDKANVLYPGKARKDGHVVFEIALAVQPGKTGEPVFTGDFAHGPPKERFLYLSWRNTNGAYAQRVKIALGAITWDQLDKAKGKPLVGEVAPSPPQKPSSTVNVGGTRKVTWSVG